MVDLLSFYPLRADAEFLCDGFLYGFRIPIDRSAPLPVFDTRSMKESMNPDCIRSLLLSDLDAHRVDGPFSSPPFENFVVSPIHAVPKDSGGFRLIHNLSFPIGDSINSRIHDMDATVQYSSFDDALDMVSSAGSCCLMLKFDIRNAFKLLPVAVEDWHLLGFYFDGNFYYEKCLSFGLRCSCLYFERFGQFLRFLLCSRSGHKNWISYLDDFFVVVPRDLPTLMSRSLDCIFELASQINLPLADEKQEGPATRVKFLGFIIDSEVGFVSLPDDKRLIILDSVTSILEAKKVNLRQVQSVAGRLAFAARIVPMGRPFIRSLYLFQKKFKLVHHRHKLTLEIREDLLMWRAILVEGFGPFRLFNRSFVHNHVLSLFTDAAASYGFGIVCGLSWVSFEWPVNFVYSKSITFLEFIPIVVSVFLFSDVLSGRKVVFNTDNEALVSILNKRTSPNAFILSLLRKFVILCVRFDIEFKALFVRGIENSAADALSRGLLDRFRILKPDANPDPVLVPHSLLRDLNLL